MQNFQKLTFSIISILIFSCSSEKLDTPFEITSPNNSLSAVVSIDEGVPYYSLSFNGTLVVDKSRLGINTDKFLLSDQLQVIKSKRRSQNKSWNQVWGEQKTIQDNYNELELTLLSNSENHKMILRFKVFNDGMTFRYEIPNQKKISNFTILDGKLPFEGIVIELTLVFLK